MGMICNNSKLLFIVILAAGAAMLIFAFFSLTAQAVGCGSEDSFYPTYIDVNSAASCSVSSTLSRYYYFDLGSSRREVTISLSGNALFNLHQGKGGSASPYSASKTYFKATIAAGYWTVEVQPSSRSASFTLNVSVAAQEEKKPNGAACTYAWDCQSNYCIHGVCRPSLIYCGDGYCDEDNGETCSGCASDCGHCATPSAKPSITPSATPSGCTNNYQCEKEEFKCARCRSGYRRCDTYSGDCVECKSSSECISGYTCKEYNCERIETPTPTLPPSTPGCSNVNLSGGKIYTYTKQSSQCSGYKNTISYGKLGLRCQNDSGQWRNFWVEEIDVAGKDKINIKADLGIKLYSGYFSECSAGGVKYDNYVDFLVFSSDPRPMLANECNRSVPESDWPKCAVNKTSSDILGRCGIPKCTTSQKCDFEVATPGKSKVYLVFQVSDPWPFDVEGTISNLKICAKAAAAPKPGATLTPSSAGPSPEKKKETPSPTPAPEKAACGNKNPEYWLGEDCKTCPADYGLVSGSCCEPGKYFMYPADYQNKIDKFHEALGGIIPDGTFIVPKNLTAVKSFFADYKPRICSKGKIVEGSCINNRDCPEGICDKNFQCVKTSAQELKKVEDKDLAERIHEKQTAYKTEYSQAYDKIKDNISSCVGDRGLKICLEIQGSVVKKNISEANKGEPVAAILSIENIADYKIAVVPEISFPGGVEIKEYTVGLDWSGGLYSLLGNFLTNLSKFMGGKYLIMPPSSKAIVYSKFIPTRTGNFEIKGTVSSTPDTEFTDASPGLADIILKPQQYEEKFKKAKVTESIFVKDKLCNWLVCL